MKPSISPRVVALFALGLMAPLTAQNLTGDSDLSESRMVGYPGTFDVPVIERAKGEVSDVRAVIAAQDPATLDSGVETVRKVESVVDLDVLRKPSAYRKDPVSAKGQPYEVCEDALELGLAQIAAAYREAGTAEEAADCQTVALSVEQQVKQDRSMVLEIVGREVAANTACACEVVKTAINVSEAGVEEVVAIVETAIMVSPDTMRIVSQCAIATMPDSIAGVQALLARVDANAGDAGYSSKGAKSAKSGKEGAVASMVSPVMPNPLDLPTGPPMSPPPYFPPRVTNVNP